MKKSAALLTDPTKPRRYRIDVQLGEGNQMQIEHNNGDIARAHYEELRAQLSIGGSWIRRIEFTELFR